MSDNICSLPHCNIVAESRCAGCKDAFYCSRDHQKKHWNSHKLECAGRERCSTKTSQAADPHQSIDTGADGGTRSCRCMFCGELMEFKSEAEAIAHMSECPSLQEQLNDDNQFTLPESMR